MDLHDAVARTHQVAKDKRVAGSALTADAIELVLAELDAAHARMHRALDVARAETREAHARRRLAERERDTARARVAELEAVVTAEWVD